MYIKIMKLLMLKNSVFTSKPGKKLNKSHSFAIFHFVYLTRKCLFSN